MVEEYNMYEVIVCTGNVPLEGLDSPVQHASQSALGIIHMSLFSQLGYQSALFHSCVAQRPAQTSLLIVLTVWTGMMNVWHSTGSAPSSPEAGWCTGRGVSCGVRETLWGLAVCLWNGVKHTKCEHWIKLPTTYLKHISGSPAILFCRSSKQSPEWGCYEPNCPPSTPCARTTSLYSLFPTTSFHLLICVVCLNKYILFSK